MSTFSDIKTRNELADFLNIPRSKLSHVLYIAKTDSFYKKFEIPKKQGGTRHISATVGDLKEIQQQLAAALWEHQCEIWKRNNVSPNISHAFEKGKSIITNARIHRKKRIVANIDLENFFDSFHFGRVCGYFEKNRDFLLSHEVAVTIAQLTCYEGKLPQGAPSSPIITNMLSQFFDFRLLKLAKKYRLDFTRYADDLTFSTNDKHFVEHWDAFYSDLANEVNRAGFKINEKKTCVQYKDSRQNVTGLVVNEKLSVDHRYYKKVRAMAHSLYVNGEYYIDDSKGTLRQLEGRFAFINQIDKYNNLLDDEKHDVFHLNSREKQYQKFLFFRYFYFNDKPLIVTEGKTDVRYIKAALKNLYKEYPTLIERKGNGEFVFKVSFLKRTKRIKYLLGVSQDGADAMKNLYNYFSDNGKNCSCNYYKMFKKLTKKSSTNPVILVFDNELSNNKKPLYSFWSHIKLDNKNKEKFMSKRFLRIFDDSNLFIVTNQLIGGQTECEIEMLFDESTRGHVIEGRTFSACEDYDTKKYYGKEIFSKYVQNNYQKIDFTGFKPLLDCIKLAIEEYSGI